jgi:hypothetical protein
VGAEIAGTGEFIGFTGLNPMPDGVPGADGVEVGWRLDRHAWHHGYATEAARAALGVAFDGVCLEEIWSITAVLNEPSQAVMRRLGLTEVARFDHPRIPAGHPCSRTWPTTGRGRRRPDHHALGWDALTNPIRNGEVARSADGWRATYPRRHPAAQRSPQNQGWQPWRA